VLKYINIESAKRLSWVERGDRQVDEYWKTINQKELKKNILNEELLREYLGELDQERSKMLGQKIQVIPFQYFKKYYETGNRTTYEAVYFERRKRLVVFGLSYWLYDRQGDKEILEDIMWEICNEYSWALPAHIDREDNLFIDLFASETAFALSEIIQLLGKKLDDHVVKRCLSEVKRRVINPFISGERVYSWESMKNNWCAVIGGSIMVTAIYNEDQRVVEQIYKRLKPTFTNYMESFEEDGTCLEGISYWTYGMSFYMAAAEALHFSGNDDLLNTEKLQKIATFQQKCYFLNGDTVSFSDARRHDKFLIGLTMYLSSVYPDVEIPPKSAMSGFNEDECYRWCIIFRDLVWTVTYKANQSLLHVADQQKSSNKERYYPLTEANWLICPGSSIHQEGYAAAMKGGHNDVAHNHNDVGSFSFYKSGVEVLADLGAGEYVKNSFNHLRYTIFCNRSMGHSVPIINGKEQQEGEQYKAVLNGITKTSLDLDIHHAYEVIEIDKLQRKFLFSYAEGLTVTDVFLLNDTVEVKERFISRIKPKIYNEDGKKAVSFKWDNERAMLEANDHPDLERIEITNYKHAEHDGTIVEVYATDFCYRMKKGEHILCFSMY